VYAERELGGFFLDVTPEREAIARYGLTVREVQGDHMNLLVEPNVQDTAGQILDYMRSISERVQYAVRGRSGSTGSIDTVGVAAQQTPQ
jgi:Cu/Ag efflux pump CusA